MQEYIKQLSAFIWAVVTNWAGYTTGGLVVALLSLWSNLKQIPISRKVGIIVTLVFLFFAFFNAWRDQYNKTQPGLRLKIEDTITGVFDNHKVLILSTVSLSNVGSPSVADNWRMRLQTTSGYSAYYLPTAIISPLTIPLPNKDQQPLVYQPSDAIYTKSMGSPLSTGMKLNGIVQFVLDKVNVEDVRNEGTITIYCTDAFGNEISGTEHFHRSAGGSEIMMYPGMESPVKPH